MKKYFITGGFGFIGSELISQLDGEITVLSRSDKNKAQLEKNVQNVILKNLSELQKEDLRDVDVIYHLASTVDNYNVLTDPYIDVNTNINGTIHLLELCKNLEKKPLIIFPSTFFVYGNEYEKTKTPVNEESRTDPLAIYPATKLCTESIIKLYAKLYDIRYIIARLTNVYGESEHFNNKKKGGLNYLIMQAVKGEPLGIYNGGNFYRDYIHVEDVVKALRFIENHARNDLFLIGYGKPILFKEMIDYIFNQTDKKSTITAVEPPTFHKIVGITNFLANTEKINKLGWHPTIDYKTGLERIVNRYKNIHS